MSEELTGGYHSAPVRDGDTVVRTTGPWSRNVHALLRHLDNSGFTQAPRFISADHTAQSETLSFVTGQPGTYPLTTPQRSDEALMHVGHAIRAMHDATAGFISPEPGAWQYRAAIPADLDCIGHNDLGPYNIVYDGSHIAAIIDWDFAGPSNRIWDLCYAAHRFVPLSAPRSTRAFGWDPPPDQPTRLRLLTDAYGHGIKPADLLDPLIVRLSAITTYIEAQIRLGNPKFDRQRDERHTDAYREDMHYILTNREHLLGSH
jgi:hypothetical protein